MSTVRVRRKLESEHLHLPELKPLIGKTVEITVVEQSATKGAAIDGEDLSWENLDYNPGALKPAGQVPVKIERRGRLQPPAHDLDQE